LIFAADPDRARAFYARVFGWTLPERECRTGWVVTTSDDPRLGVDGPDADDARDTHIPTVHVADLDATVAAARAAGGDVLVPRLPVPGVGWLAYLADTEDNVLGVMQDDPNAST
jgi:predicted enzyme related to lactoylglutathione lyase